MNIKNTFKKTVAIFGIMGISVVSFAVPAKKPAPAKAGQTTVQPKKKVAGKTAQTQKKQTAPKKSTTQKKKQAVKPQPGKADR